MKHPRNHNGGPPLEEPKYRPEWGRGIGVYFHWKKAHREFWRSVPQELMRRRAEKAESLGLTYEEYTLEIVERGRYLQPADAARCAEIRRARKRR